MTLNENVTATQLHVDAILLQYQALAAATANNPVATKAPALIWDREYELIHNILPVWAKKLIVSSPDLFDTRANLWAELHRHEPAQQVSFKSEHLFPISGLDDDDEVARLGGP